ncbi:MAG: two-component system response regulator NarL [Betaproteobacteria bacterium]|nr:two-component system response regulator NarL [Betaproteobacteria bacterium]
MSKTNSVVIIDDHPLFRKGVHQLLDLEPALTVVAEASSGEEGVQLVAQHEPDLVLLDLNMKGMGGLKALEAIKQRNPDIRVVVLTVSDTSDDLIGTIRAGADGYLLKDMEPEELLAHIKEAVFGSTVIASGLAGRLATALREEATAKNRNVKDLTEREMQILRSLAGGKSNKLIARDLDITEGTVKVHVKHLLRKLNFRSRVEAAVWVVENKLG